LGEGTGLGLEAGAKSALGPELAREAFGRAAAAYDAVDMPVHAAAARMRMGGADAVDGATAMRERGVVKPDRMAALLMPAR
jgi:hypothetical protein